MLSSLLPWQFSSCRCLCYFFTSTRSTCLSQGHLQHISEPPSKTTNYSVCLADFATSPPSSTATWKKGSGRQPAVALKWSSLTHMFLQRLGNSWMSALRTSTALKWWMWSLPCYNKSLCTEHFQLQAWKPQTIRRLQDFLRVGYFRHLFGVFVCVVVWLDSFGSPPPTLTVVLLCFSPNREQQQQGKKDAAQRLAAASLLLSSMAYAIPTDLQLQVSVGGTENRLLKRFTNVNNSTFK